MKSDLFQHEIRNTSAVFGRKNDVRVVFAGNDAKTDGSTIILPELTRGVEVDGETAAILRGYTDHESGHIRHTDMKLMSASHAAWGKQGRRGALKKALHNAIEDVWLEARVLDEYPGAEPNLIATSNAVNKNILERMKSGEISEDTRKDAASIGPLAITWAGRHSYATGSCEECLSMIDPAVREAAEKWAAMIAACKDTTDTLALTDTIYDHITGAAPLPPPEEEDEEEREGRGKGKGDGEGKAKGEDGEAGDDEKGGGEGEGEAPSPFHGTDSNDDDREGNHEVSGDSSVSVDVTDYEAMVERAEEREKALAETGEGFARADPKALPDVVEGADLRETVMGAIKDAGLANTGKRAYRPATTEFDRWYHQSLAAEDGRSAALAAFPKLTYDRRIAEMQGSVNVIRRRLERALMSKQVRDWDVAKEQGRLDSKRFTAAVAGRTNVFKERTERADMDTAVTILVDLSGSMCGHEIDVARDCILALVEAIDKTGVAYEVVGFDNSFSAIHPKKEGMGIGDYDDYYNSEREFMKRMEDLQKASRGGGGFARYDPLRMTIFKAFEERLFEAKGPLGNINAMAGGNNSDGEAVMMAYSRLKARPEKRKVFLAFSDGQPSCRSDDHAALKQHLRDSIEMLRKDGVGCVGIGIGDDAVSHYYPEYVVVKSLDDLATSALSMLAKQLLGERVQVDLTKLMAAS